MLAAVEAKLRRPPLLVPNNSIRMGTTAVDGNYPEIASKSSGKTYGEVVFPSKRCASADGRSRYKTTNKITQGGHQLAGLTGFR